MSSEVCTWVWILVMSGTYAAIEPVILLRDNASCPLQAASEDIRARINDFVHPTLLSFTEIQANCGEGTWHQVADLDMSDASQHCPSSSGWQEVSTIQGIRGCQKLSYANDSGCLGVMYPTGRQYSSVCGRATGYQIGGTSAFGYILQPSIDTFYHYGLSLTHGMPHKRTHIWTFAIGLSDEAVSAVEGWECPCNMNDPRVPVPSFVGDNYFCESGNPTAVYVENHLYGDDPVWDGKQCEGEGRCCSADNSPPWFSLDLPSSTSDDIEARLCIPTDSPTEGVILQKLEMYIQ